MVNIILGYIYKLKPSIEQSNKMHQWLNMLRTTYNYNLADRINCYQSRFVFGNYCDIKTKAEICPLTCPVGGATGYPWKIQGVRKGNPTPDKRNPGEIQSALLPELKLSRPWYKGIDSTVLQFNIERLDKAYQGFFEGKGFPRFQNRSTFRSFTYKSGVKVNENKIYFPKIGEISFFNSRPIPSGFNIKSVTLRLKASGWFISIKIEDKSIPAPSIISIEDVQSVVGCDVGIRKLIVQSDNKRIENPKFSTNKKTRKLMNKRQRRVNRKARRTEYSVRQTLRKRKRSKNRRKAANIVARLHQKITDKRSAYQWKIATNLAKRSDVIFMEDLKVSNLKKRCKPNLNEETGRYLNNGQSRKAGLNRAISDSEALASLRASASWYELRTKIHYAAEKRGKIFEVVPPHYTSQQCPECHHADALNRSGEVFICTECGYFSDADHVGGLNIKYRGAAMLGIPLKCRIKIVKVREDFAKPKQLQLFETPTVESPTNQRRKHRTRKGERDVPGNPPIQLNVWDIKGLA
ncbi:MAG: transposase [Rhizonema sp. PD37]|nr:transposase [Rhizonema sp. PD37]